MRPFKDLKKIELLLSCLLLSIKTFVEGKLVINQSMIYYLSGVRYFRGSNTHMHAHTHAHTHTHTHTHTHVLLCALISLLPIDANKCWTMTDH